MDADSKLIVMGVSAGIGFLSLILSLYSAHLTRRNNRLSVKPKLTFYDNWYKEDGYLGLTVKNNGHGMAQIKEMKIYWDNSEIKNQKNKWERFILLAAIDKSKVFYQNFLAGDAIAAGETIPLIFFKDKYDDETISSFKNAIRNNLRIEISYSSVYEVKYKDSFN